MRQAKLLLFAVAASAFGLVAEACSSSAAPPGLGSTTATGTGTGTARPRDAGNDGTAQDSGPARGDSSVTDAPAVDSSSESASREASSEAGSFDAAPTGDGPLGGLQIVDEPTSACLTAGGTTTTLYAGPSSPPFSRLATVGTRRVAGGPDVGGFVTFDVGGTNPSSPPTSVGAVATDVASEGATIGTVGSDPNDVVYQRFDPTGNALGPAVTLVAHLSSNPVGVGIGGAAGDSLVVWGSGGSLYAAGVNAGAPAGSPFLVAAGVYKTDLVTSVAATGNGYAIAWTGDPATGATESGIAFANATALTGAPILLTVSSLPFKVRKLVAIPSGYVLLFDGDPIGTDDVYILPLDVGGNVAGPAHRFLGSDIAWDVAVVGTQLGMIAEQILAVDGAAMNSRLFRPLDFTGHALGSWVCVGAPQPAGRVDMAIDGDGPGFAIVSQDPSGDRVLTRFNAMGQ